MGVRINGTKGRPDSRLWMGNEDEISIRSASARRPERPRSHETRRFVRTNTHEHDCEMFVVLRGAVRLEVSTSDVRVAFMHAIASERKFAKPPVEQRAAGWLWLVKKAMHGMRTASKDFGDLVADVMKEIHIERGKADAQIYKDTKSQATIVFHVDDPILAASHQQTALVWNRIGKHMLLKAHE